VKTLVIVKNDAHMKHLRDYAIAFMLTEAKTNSACAYHIKRKTVISKLGIDEDETQQSPLKAAIPNLLESDEEPTTSTAIVVQDKDATSGEKPATSDAGSDPGSDASESDSGSDSGSDAKSQVEKDPLDDLFGEGTADSKGKAKAKAKAKGRKNTKPEESEDAIPGAKVKGKGKGKVRGKKNNLEESVAEPPLKKRIKGKTGPDSEEPALMILA
jgi:hypothetical protein